MAAKTQGVVPKLRFPEFCADSAWTHEPLGKFCEVNPATDSLPAEFFYIDLGSVDAGELKSKTWISKDGAPSRAQRVLRPSDVLFQIVRPYQRNNLFFDLNDGVYVASTGYALLRSKQSPAFLYQLLHTDTFVGKVISQCTGSNYPAINASDLAEIEIDHPEPDEQQKVADCLSSLDACIGAETRKLDALKAHKQGLLQQLFPAEGQCLPRLRFPGFAGEWQLKQTGEVFKVTRGQVLSMTSVSGTETPENPYPVYSSQTKNDGLAGYFSEYLYEDAITWTTDGANAGDVNYRAGKFYCTNVCGVLIDQHGYANSCVAALIGSVAKNYVSYVGNPKLMNGVMAEIEIPLPSVAEQQKIAACLSSLDELIAAQSRKLAALQQHKKGLMQGLFPALDAHVA